MVLTLDRNFTDPLPFYSGVAYQMYGAYIPMPVGFKRFLSVADMFDVWTMDIWTPRRTLDYYDPARLVSSNPTVCAPLGADRRGAGTATPSATLNQQLIELYPYPTTEIGYQWYAVIEAPYLVNNSDTLPPPIDEEVVTQKALTWVYRDAEARKDIMAAKGSGGNYLALKKESETDFLTRLKTLRLRPRQEVRLRLFLECQVVPARALRRHDVLPRFRIPVDPRQRLLRHHFLIDRRRQSVGIVDQIRRLDHCIPLVTNLRRWVWVQLDQLLIERCRWGCGPGTAPVGPKRSADGGIRGHQTGRVVVVKRSTRRPDVHRPHIEHVRHAQEPLEPNRHGIYAPYIWSATPE